MGVIFGGNVGLLLFLLLIRVNYISTNQSKTTFMKFLSLCITLRDGAFFTIPFYTLMVLVCSSFLFHYNLYSRTPRLDVLAYI